MMAAIEGKEEHQCSVNPSFCKWSYTSFFPEQLLVKIYSNAIILVCEVWRQTHWHEHSVQGNCSLRLEMWHKGYMRAEHWEGGSAVFPKVISVRAIGYLQVLYRKKRNGTHWNPWHSCKIFKKKKLSILHCRGQSGLTMASCHQPNSTAVASSSIFTLASTQRSFTNAFNTESQNLSRHEPLKVYECFT